MTAHFSKKSPRWSSSLVFVLAASGSAVGLGNFWRFPFAAGDSGGAAFVLIYALAILLIGFPLMVAEIFIGKRGRANPAEAYLKVAQEVGTSRAWRLVGMLAIVSAVLSLASYSVIAGWSLAFVGEAVAGSFAATAEQVVALFADLIANPWRLLLWHSVFMLAVMAVVARGVEDGLQPAAKVLVPLLLLLLACLLFVAWQSGYTGHAWDYLFSADFSKLTPNVILSAIAMAFFSLSLGSGAIITYASYLPDDVSIPRVAATIVGVDTLVALVGGLLVFPFVFAVGLPAAESVDLVFQSLPVAFAQYEWNGLLTGAFYVLLVIAVFTTALSLLEPGVSWLVSRSHLARGPATFVIGFIVWAIGLIPMLSLNLWSEWRPLAAFPIVGEMNAFRLLDGLTAHYLLPLGGLLLAWFVTRFITRGELMAQLGLPYPLFAVWKVSLQYLVRFALGLILLNTIGLLPWLAETFGMRWY